MEWAKEINVRTYQPGARVIQARDSLTVANVVVWRTPRCNPKATESHTVEVAIPRSGELHLKIGGGHGTLIVRLPRVVVDQILRLEREHQSELIAAGDEHDPRTRERVPFPGTIEERKARLDTQIAKLRAELKKASNRRTEEILATLVDCRATYEEEV